MQKINFLPQVKVWSTIEFAPVATLGLTPEVDGILTYDDANNAFKVSVAGDNNTHIEKTILLDGTNASDSCSRNFIDGGMNNINYGQGTSDTDTRYILEKGVLR